MHAETFLDGLYFGEGPRWHDGRLWFSDFFHRAVFSVDEGGNRRREVEVPNRPSGLGWLPDGRLLIVSMSDRAVLVWDGRELTPYADLSALATHHTNDMVVDAQGRAYVGNFGFDIYDRSATVVKAPLIRIDPDGTVEIVAPDLEFPNGTVIFPDGKTLVVGESFGFRLTAFDVDAGGTLSNRRVWAQFTDCAPDGICLDADGCIWVANAGGKECRRVAEGGETLEVVETSETAFACMLGGADRRTLFVITSPTSDEEIVQRAPLGKIERARVSVPGAGLP